MDKEESYCTVLLQALGSVTSSRLLDAKMLVTVSVAGILVVVIILISVLLFVLIPVLFF